MSTLNHGLTNQQVEQICLILQPFADKIEQVCLFGSRAQGRHRPNSDIDLVLYGDISEPVIDCLWTLFNESSLPFKVDINAYNLVNYAPLKAHMDAVCVTLLTHDDLV